MATLADIPLRPQEEERLAKEFADTLAVIDNLRQLDVSQIEPTHQVTGLENVTREDVVNKARMFTQEEALANARQTHDGFFVVPRIIDRDES